MVVTLTLILFLIMDPIGNISSYLLMVKGIDQKRLKYIAIREMLIALAAAILFNFIGEFILDKFHISPTTVRVASGVILFLIAIKILFPSPSSLRANLPREEPFIIPLAIPLIAGPSLLATIMLYAHTENQTTMLAAILLSWLLAVIVLLLASPIQRLLGNNGLVACERLMGMILVLLAVQRFLEGIKEFGAIYCAK